MAQVAWPRDEALKILKRHTDSERPILLETGFGPSGLPHIGTFAEVVRTLFVIAALKEEAPEREVKLFVFCDDLDGLRSLPENVPNHETLKPHLGKPLSAIPDPFGQAESFSGHMNGKLQEFLDQYGFEYEYKSSTQCYRSGQFDPGLKAVMDHYDEVRNLFIKTIGTDKRESWSPFFPICEGCGKIYTTRVTQIDRDNYEVEYVCDKAEAAYSSCGYKGKQSIFGGLTKVGWKVDWALRWFVFQVDYEMYGKDLMESASLSGKICQALGGKAPIPYKYELFLDENGAKISKKIGNGISMDQWLRYAPLGALLGFLLGNPNKAKKMGLPILPKLVDEFLQMARSGHSSEIFSPPWFIAQVQHQTLSDTPELDSDLTYALLFNLSDALSIRDPELLFDYACKYDPKVNLQSEFFKDLCSRICLFAQEQGSEVEESSEPDPLFLPLLKKLAVHLSTYEADSLDGDALQTYLFSLAKEAGYNPRDWFGFLYLSLLQRTQGPKMGPFMAIMGVSKSLEMVSTGLKRLGV